MTYKPCDPVLGALISTSYIQIGVERECNLKWRDISDREIFSLILVHVLTPSLCLYIFPHPHIHTCSTNKPKA